ncbi:hypothetical protein [Rhizobium leguminosarum]|uniref:hypothetical protein n=1 Tax=Rhizobium leguminosarum TaxID=384 RepID=UPI003F998DDD
MIANAARLEAKGELTGEVPTRLTILGARIEEAVKDVGRRAGTGAAAARHALTVLGRLIAESEDGRVPVKGLPESGSATLVTNSQGLTFSASMMK